MVALDFKSFLSSTEVLSGFGLIVAGLGAHVMGFHDVFAQALAPFGVGMILSDGISRAAKTTRERVRVRRDDD